MSRFTSSVATSSVARNDSWKAQGFLNFYLPSRENSRKKLGAIGLKASKASEKALLDWLNEDASRTATVLAKVQLEYVSAASPSAKFIFTADMDVGPAPAEGRDAVGYVNFFLPTKDGNRRKLGTIALKSTDVDQNALNTWLAKDEANVEQMRQALQLEYRSATPASTSEFDLS